MKLLEANKGPETPPHESDANMYTSTTPTKPPLHSLKLDTDNATNGDHNLGISCRNNLSEYMNNNKSASMTSPHHAFSSSSDLETEISLEEEEGECLEYVEDGHPSFVLAGINHLRKQGHFCDIILVVEDHELPVHRAVLAACSPYMFDFFSCLEETSESQPTYKLKDVAYDGFHHLVDYMYTGRLHVPVDHVTVVYATALELRMESAARACTDFLASHLTATNCLGIRRFTKDKDFKETVDEYIRSNIVEIMHGKSFFGLTDLQVEVVGLDEDISDEAMERMLFSLILDWAKNNLNDLKPKLDRLTEKVNVLYLESDNTLRDCAEQEDIYKSSDDEMVQDYKILARRRSKAPNKGGNARPAANGNGVQPFHKFSLNPEEALSVAEREWSIVATRKTNENAYLALAVLDGALMAISAHVRPIPASGGSESNGINPMPDSPPVATLPVNRLSPVLRKASILPLEGMTMARCAMGAVELDGKLIVCGGYDRGECIQAVEAFTVKDNQWTQLSAMNRPRARLNASVLDGCIYGCGGSDGWKELACVEKYDPATDKWTYVANMMKERSSHGVATLDGKLCCVGGCEGQRSIATCEVYDPTTNAWSRIASLNTARSQTCVCTINGLLFAIGGTDLWNTLGTVEVYDPQKDEWVIGSGLNIARRGAGVGIVDDKIVVVGGSDGTQSLVSSEIYDFLTNTWSMGPPLNTPRANLSVVTVGNRLFAVGGFSGKKFLNSLEWLDLDDMEWFGHTPRQDVDGDTRSSSGSDAGSGPEDVEQEGAALGQGSAETMPNKQEGPGNGDVVSPVEIRLNDNLSSEEVTDTGSRQAGNREREQYKEMTNGQIEKS